MARLFVVGTPIGNLNDCSPRAKEALAAADVVFCEDTRVTRRLLAAFDIHTPLRRADAHQEDRAAEEAVAFWDKDEAVAFASDAGMPCISDPGRLLVDAARDRGVRVEVIPGPSAVSAAIAASGLCAGNFFFEGFLPRKPAGRLAELARIPGALVMFESPHRVKSTVKAIGDVMGERRMALLRELTKVHEECIRGLPAEVLSALDGREVKGECVIVVEEPAEGAPGKGAGMDAGESPAEAPEAYIASHGDEPPSSVAKALRRIYGLSRAEAYDMIVQQKQTSGD